MAKKKEKIYWKVCRLKDGKYLSFIKDLGEWELEYKENKWTRPRVGVCFIFETKQDADRFAGFSSNFPVRRCLAQNPRKPRRKYIMDFMCTHLFRDFWRRKVKGYFTIRAGTLFADAVKILPA